VGRKTVVHRKAILYLDETFNVLFYTGLLLGFGLSAWLVIIAKKIKIHIKELGEL